MSSTELRKRFYERYVSTHAGRGDAATLEKVQARFPAFAKYFGAFLPADRNAAILDLGCGHGAFLCFLKSRGYCNASGVDISPEQVATAHNLGLHNVECGDTVVALRSRQNAIAMVAAFDVLEHLGKEEVMALLDAVYCSLVPGGTLVIQTVNAESPFFGAVRYGDMTHENAFTRESITQILSVAGFMDIRVRPAGPVIHGVVSLIRALIWRAFQVPLRLASAAETGELRRQIFTRNLIAAACRPRTPFESREERRK